VLEWAIAMDLRNDNPCDRVVPVLGPQNDTVTHRQALPHKDVAAAIETVRGGAAQRSRPSGWRSSFWCSRRPSPNNEPLRDTSNEPLALDGVLTLAKLQVAGEVPEAATTGDRIRSAERAKVKRSEAEANGCDRTEAATR